MDKKSEKILIKMVVERLKNGATAEEINDFINFYKKIINRED